MQINKKFIVNKTKFEILHVKQLRKKHEMRVPVVEKLVHHNFQFSY